MKIPSQNLLNMALSVITKQIFTYNAYLGRINTAIGTLVSSYADPITVRGSVQPVPRRLFQQLGLELQKNYSYFYLSKAVIDVDRDTSGDQFIYNDQTWQILSRTSWDITDGWDQVLCVQVPNVNNFYITESGFGYSNEAGNQQYAAE